MDEDLKARLLKPRLTEADVEIEGVGTVRVRCLTRAEVLMLQAIKGAARERRMVALGMVDPVMTEAEVGAWTKTSPSGELEKVTIKIAELSGLTVVADKEAYQEFEDDPAAEFRVLPGAEIEHDGSGAPLGDE